MRQCLLVVTCNLDLLISGSCRPGTPRSFSLHDRDRTRYWLRVQLTINNISSCNYKNPPANFRSGQMGKKGGRKQKKGKPAAPAQDAPPADTAAEAIVDIEDGVEVSQATATTTTTIR